MLVAQAADQGQPVGQPERVVGEHPLGLDALVVAGVDDLRDAAKLGVEAAVVLLVGDVGADHPVEPLVALGVQAQLLRAHGDLIVEQDV